jgi:hypothetical protein
VDIKTQRQLLAFRRGRRGRHWTCAEEARQESIILGTYREAAAASDEQDSSAVYQVTLDKLLEGTPVEKVLSRADPDHLAVVKVAIINWRRLRRSQAG